MSVVVVSFNTRDRLRRCLTCLSEVDEVIVVDNASADGSPDMVRAEFPSVLLIANTDNAGFGVANNQGCDAATGDLVLFLNSDAYAQPGAIWNLAAVFRDPVVVGAGGRLLNPDGSLQVSTANTLTLWAVFCEQTFLERLFPRSPFFSPYWTTFRNRDRTEPWPAEQVMGACLMVRAVAGQPVARFDPRFFLYVEDTDLCHRLHRHGKILHVPSAQFVHDLGSSSAKDPAMGIIRYNRGKELYFCLHQGLPVAWVCLLLDRFGALLRLLAWAVVRMGSAGTHAKGSRQVATFWRVLTAPIRFTERPSPSASTRTPG